MTEALAVIDTDVLVLLLDNRKDRDGVTNGRRERALEIIRESRDKRRRFIITAPTVVELAAWPGGPPKALARVRQMLAGARVHDLTLDAALVTGQILLRQLKSHPPGKGRNEIKFDALIAGSAHAMEAKCLITGNAKDYRPLLERLKSPVEVIDINEPKGQLLLSDQALTKK